MHDKKQEGEYQSMMLLFAVAVVSPQPQAFQHVIVSHDEKLGFIRKRLLTDSGRVFH
jgi:hypothetical protein